MLAPTPIIARTESGRYTVTGDPSGKKFGTRVAAEARARKLGLLPGNMCLADMLATSTVSPAPAATIEGEGAAVERGISDADFRRTCHWKLGGQDSTTGFDRAPARYMGKGRETIDRIRDLLGDEGFYKFCIGTALKYEDRAGLKDHDDREKVLFYTMMALHVVGMGPDPREKRPDFRPYRRP